MFTFIVNPNSGGERGYRIWKNLERLLIRDKIEYRSYLTNGAEDAVSLAERLTSDRNGEDVTLIAVGGDGTMNAVLNGIRISDHVTLGFIPTGSGNDLAIGLKLPGNPEACLKRILTPKEIKRTDYGILSYTLPDSLAPVNRRFLNSSGVGYDALINLDIRKASLKKKLAPFGMQKLSYIMAGAERLKNFRTVRGEVVLDGVKKVEFNHIFFISSHIHPTEGGGYRFAPKADDTDGELTVCIIHNRSKKHLTRILFSSMFGNHLKYEGVRSYNCTEMQVHLEDFLPVHADGEDCGELKDFELRCVRQKLKFIV